MAKNSNDLITSYSFGSIVINNKTYEDIKIIVAPEKTEILPWHYIKHHTVTLKDIEEIVKEKPKLIVVGTGYYGIVKVEQEVIDFCEKNNIDLIIKPTEQAINILNNLLNEFKNQNKTIGAIIHATC